MSSESVGSGASHNQLPSPTGMIATIAINIQYSGLSMARINPTVVTVIAHAINTRSFRCGNVISDGSESSPGQMFNTAHQCVPGLATYPVREGVLGFSGRPAR
jgi:hypothetical protein